MEQIVHLIIEMAPYLLLGFLFAGILHVFVPARFYTTYLADNSFRSVLYAALLGIPLPLCSCGVLPTALSLHKEGVSKGATTSFLIATPQTGVDSILATYSLMGPAMAVIRPLAALVTSLLGGLCTNMVEQDKKPAQEKLLQTEGCSCCCHCSSEEKGDYAHRHEAQHVNHHGISLWQRVKEVCRYAFIEMVDDIGHWLVSGLLIAALITVFVPNGFFAVFAGNTWLSMLLVLLISIPMYICATGSIPIAVALMLKGLSPGTAFVMLMAGPACNFASILLIRKRLGVRASWTYLVSIIAGAILTGMMIDHVLPDNWFVVVEDVACCHEESVSWTGAACTLLLAGLLTASVIRRLNSRNR